MKLVDVVNQFRALLPKYTERFSSTQSVASIVTSGGTATITTSSAHGLTTGQLVAISDVQTQTAILAESKDGLIFTFTTATDHDLTYGWPDHETVELIGFTDTSWNDDFTLTDVPNRRTFKVQSTNSEPTLNGNEKLLEIRADGVNGTYAVTVVSTTAFTIAGGFEDGTYIGGTVSTGVRIAGTVDIARAIEQYTEQGVSDLWAFVSMHDAEVSKNRHAMSDASSTPVNGSSFRERIIDGFSLYIIVNTSQDIAAQDAVDICRHELLTPILKSAYGAQFDTGLAAATDFKNVLTGHGFVSYDRAVYVHVYNFEMSMDLTELDAVEPENTRAYRDTAFTQTIDEQDMTITINQDDEPIVP